MYLIPLLGGSVISFQHKCKINTFYGSQRQKENRVKFKTYAMIFASAITSAACAVDKRVTFLVSAHVLMQNSGLFFQLLL